MNWQCYDNVCFSAGEDIYLFIPGDSSHEYSHISFNTEGLNYIIFDVKACSGVKVSLSWIPLNVNVSTFELVLGTVENKGVAIRDQPDGSDAITAAEDVELLDCSTFKTFFVRWSKWPDQWIRASYVI